MAFSSCDVGIRVNRRRANLGLESRERASQEKLIKFLMGLEGLPRDMLSKVGTNERDFSESQVWIEGAPHVLRESRNERATLIAADTITRCVGIVRMVGTVCIPGSIGFRQPLAGVLQVRTQELVPLLALLVQPHKRSRAPPPGWF